MIAFSTVRNIRDNRPVMDTRPSWGAFADYLEAQAKRPGIDKAKTLCISPAIYEDGVIRAKRRVAGWQWFAADIDDKGQDNAPTITAIADTMIAHGTPFVIYTTSSHTPGAHRFRLMFPLNRVVTPDEFPTFWQSIAQWLGCLDAATKDESRLFVAPRAWPGAEFIRHDEGTPLDVDLHQVAHPVTIVRKPRRSLTSAFVTLEGLKPMPLEDIGFHGQFVTPEIVSHATTANGRVYSFMCSVALRALLKGYAISPNDLVTMGEGFGATIQRSEDSYADIERDAMNAHAAAVSRYAEIKAEKMEAVNPLRKNIDKWRAKR